MKKSSRQRILAGAAVVGLLVVASCGSDSDESGSDDTASVNAASTEPTGTELSGTEPADTEPAGTEPAGPEPASTDAPVGETETLVITEIAELTGNYAGNVVPAHRGLELGINQINADGGVVIDGTTYMLELNTVDNASDPDQAIAAVQQAMADGNNIIVGPYISALASPAVELMKGQDVLAIAPFSTAVAATRFADPEAYSNVVVLQSLNSEFLGCYMPMYVELSGADSMAIIMSDDQSGQGIVASVQDVLADIGTQITTEMYDPATTDFTTLVKKAADADPDLILAGLTPTQVQSILRTAADNGIEIPFAGSSGSGKASAVEATGGPLEGYMWTQLGPSFDGEPSPLLEQVMGLWQETYGEDITENAQLNGNVFFGWDGAYMLKEALENAGSVDDVAAIVDGYRNLSYSGLADFEFDDNAKATYDIEVGRFENGEPVYYPCDVQPTAE